VLDIQHVLNIQHHKRSVKVRLKRRRRRRARSRLALVTRAHSLRMLSANFSKGDREPLPLERLNRDPVELPLNHRI
jgi:hypothetical protein